MNRFLKISTIVASVVLSGANTADITINNFDPFYSYFDIIGDSAILKQAHKTDNIYLHRNPAYYTEQITNSEGVIIGYNRPFSRVEIEANKLILDDYTYTYNGMTYKSNSWLGTWGDETGLKTLSFDITTTQGVKAHKKSHYSECKNSFRRDTFRF